MTKEAEKYCSNELIDCHRLDENEEINQWDNHYIITPEQLQAYADEVNKHYAKGVEEFALKVVYSKQKDGRHFLEIFAEDGKRKFQEWCKYKDGSFNYR